MIINVYCDGYSSPKKKDKAGIGVYIEDEQGRFITSLIKKYPLPDATNNQMEVEAIREACEEIRRLKLYNNVYIYSDSQVAVGLVNGNMRTKLKHLIPFVDKARNTLLGTAGTLGKINWIPREQNKAGRMIDNVVRGKNNG